MADWRIERAKKQLHQQWLAEGGDPSKPYTTTVSYGRGGTYTGDGAGATGLGAIRRAKAQYAPGGGFGKGVEAAITRGRTKAVSVGAQELVGAGLAGTTMMGGLGKRYEEEVGMPARLGIEEQRAQAISGIEMAQAGMGFQAGQAGVQRQFQAGQATQQRDLQRYIADLQATLQREQMAFRAQPTAAPTDGGYAQQFPSIYGQEEMAVPDWMDGGSAGGWSPPREYDPSMVGRSLWAQRGSQA